MTNKDDLKQTERFSDRVNNYVKFRPTYPTELIDFLILELGLKSGNTVVDVGSGTGIFSKLLLKTGCQVLGVEPNLEMRKSAEALLSRYSSFKSVNGKSEKTGLPDATADFIVAAQAYHWFEPENTKQEFKRILKPGAWVVLIWNDRRTSGSPFAIEYEPAHKHI